jgi:hypothetical protein
MTRRQRPRLGRRLAPLVALAAAGLLSCASAAAAVSLPPGFQARVFARGAGRTHPDDITALGQLIFVAYQRDTTPTGGGGDSTIVAYRPDGSVAGSWEVPGHCDGLTADPGRRFVIATVNEDANSSLYTITPSQRPASRLRHYTYSPDPSTLSGGGTDAISVLDGRVLISASSPAPSTPNGSTYTGPAVYTAAIPERGSVVRLTATFADDSPATDAVSGQSTTLNLSDPDSNATVPASSPRFAGDFMLDSQGDSELIFASAAGTPEQRLTLLKLGAAAAPTPAPQVADVRWSTRATGTLLVVDAGADQIDAITGPFQPGTALASVDNDSPSLASDLGRVDLSTGRITPFATGFVSPKGLLFLDGRDTGRGTGRGHRGRRAGHRPGGRR